MTPWSTRALGGEQRNESCFTWRLLDFLFWMLPQAFKASSFPSPTYHAYFALLRFKSRFVLESEASRSLSGSSAPLYLCNKGIYKGREGLEVVTALRPTAVVCAVPSLDAHTRCLCPRLSQQTPAHARRVGSCHSPHEVVNERGSLSPSAHSVSNTKPQSEQPEPGEAPITRCCCHLCLARRCCHAMSRIWTLLHEPSAGDGNLLCYSSHLPNPSQTLFLPSASQRLPVHNVIYKK